MFRFRLKNRNPLFCRCFLVSLAHKNKSVKLKKHKCKKSNVSKISVREIKREKIKRKELPTFNPQFTKTQRELSRSSTMLSSSNSRAQAMPKRLKSQKRHKKYFCSLFLLKINTQTSQRILSKKKKTGNCSYLKKKRPARLYEHLHSSHLANGICHSLFFLRPFPDPGMVSKSTHE